MSLYQDDGINNSVFKPEPINPHKLYCCKLFIQDFLTKKNYIPEALLRDIAINGNKFDAVIFDRALLDLKDAAYLIGAVRTYETRREGNAHYDVYINLSWNFPKTLPPFFNEKIMDAFLNEFGKNALPPLEEHHPNFIVPKAGLNMRWVEHEGLLLKFVTAVEIPGFKFYEKRKDILVPENAEDRSYLRKNIGKRMSGVELPSKQIVPEAPAEFEWYAVHQGIQLAKISTGLSQNSRETD